MPIQELFPKPSRDPESSNATNDQVATVPTGDQATQPIKVRAGRFGVLEEHEIIHLIDSLDDERSRARFRESIYISLIIWMAIAWFIFYGPRVLFHQPQYQDPIALMQQHDKELTFLAQHRPPALKPAPPHPLIDRKTMQQLQQQARLAAPTPPPPAQQPPEEQEHVAAPPVPQPQLPLPSAPKPTQQALPESPLPSAPRPNLAQNNTSAHDALENAMRGALSDRGGTDYGASSSRSGPLQAGATILSDTMGVDFTAYMRRLHDDIQRNWDPLIPEEVQPPLMKKGIVGIRFTILPNGDIGNMVLETRSGDVALDHAAWNAITSENQFPPLPKAFHGPQLELRVGFFYNIPLPQ